MQRTLVDKSLNCIGGSISTDEHRVKYQVGYNDNFCMPVRLYSVVSAPSWTTHACIEAMYSIERFRRPTPSQKYNFPMLLAPKPEGWEDLPPRGRRYSTILPGPSSFHDAKASALLSMFSLHPSPLRVPCKLAGKKGGDPREVFLCLSQGDNNK